MERVHSFSFKRGVQFLQGGKGFGTEEKSVQKEIKSRSFESEKKGSIHRGKKTAQEVLY